jgi:hypothetical protein
MHDVQPKEKTDSLISFSAFSTESEPWQILRPTASAKSSRIVPFYFGARHRIPFSIHTRKIANKNIGRTGGRCERVSRGEHYTTGLDSVEALPDHGDDGAGSHVLDQTREERLVLQVFVVCTRKKKRGDVRFVIVCGSERDGLTANVVSTSRDLVEALSLTSLNASKLSSDGWRSISRSHQPQE